MDETARRRDNKRRERHRSSGKLACCANDRFAWGFSLAAGVGAPDATRGEIRHVQASRNDTAIRSSLDIDVTVDRDVMAFAGYVSAAGEAHPFNEGDVIDITTRGRNTRQPRRIEIRFHNIHGHFYLMETPGHPRDWYANLLAHPEFTFHLKPRVRTNLPARATPILDRTPRRTSIAAIHQRHVVYRDVEVWGKSSPLVAVELLVE